MNKEKFEIIKLKGDIFINKLKALFVIILLLAEVFIIYLIISKYINKDSNLLISNPKTAKVAILKIDTLITTKTEDEIYNAIEKIRYNKNYKAIIVDMNSPGGSPSASQEIASYLKEVNKTIPVIMYINSIAASGGYYIASAIKPIIANKNAIVGSIGVIMPLYNISQLAKKIGIKEDTLTAGKYKEPYSPFKEATLEQKEYLKNNLLEPGYKNFLNDVAKNRDINVNKLEEYAQGKVYLANDKRIQGILIDKISNLYKIKNHLKRKYSKNIKFVVINKKSEFNLFKKIFESKLENFLQSSQKYDLQ